MPGMLAVLAATHNKDINFICKTLDLAETSITKTVSFNDGFISVSNLLKTPLKGLRYSEKGFKIYTFSGDLIGFSSIPWDKIDNIIVNNKFEKLRDFQGNFSIACIDKKKKKVTIISDRRSQHPIYYKITENGFVFSTELATFCRLIEPAEFNVNWLYIYLFFNFSVSEITFLKNVYRLPPASVLEFDLKTGKKNIIQYSAVFCKSKNPFSGNSAMKLAEEVFKNNLNKYYDYDGDIACALTDGWDGRTMVALAPDIGKINAYTYGVDKCSDVTGASKTAKKAGVKHRRILFNKEFVSNLPDYIVKTVFLSSGLQNILRSTLLYVYQTLTKKGEIFPLTISGIALDELFRGNHASPNPISYDVEEIFKKGDFKNRENFWSDIFGDRYSKFYETIQHELKQLKKTFGDFKSTEHHLLFKMYIQGPHYFSGELKIADCFTTLRVPSWDAKIIELAFKIKESALTFSSFTGKKRSGRDVVELQSHILSKLSPKFAKIPVRNTRPDIVLKGQRAYELYMLYSLIIKKINSFREKSSLLEDWDKWLNVLHKDFIDRLIFSEDSRIKDYIDSSFLKKTEELRDIHWVGKFATAEIIIRLIENRWQTEGLL